jgi:hypothetical protein
VGGEAVSSTTARSPRIGTPVGWDLLGLLGLALFVVGGTDFLLTWVPMRFGNPEWEFATITAAFGAVPATLLGLTLLLMRALQEGATMAARLWSVMLILWALGLVGVGVIYGLTLPLAARGFETPTVGVGLKKAIARTLVQLLVYTIVMIWLGIRGLKLSRSATS